MEEEKAISELFLSIMGDYRDSVIPPLSHFCPLPPTTNTRSRSTDKDRKTQLPQEQTYKISRKEVLRRQKVSELFKVLQIMVPTLHFKPTQATVVKETIHYITELEQKLMMLEARREASAAAAAAVVVANSYTQNQNLSVEVRVSGDIAFFGIESVVMQKSLTVKALMVLEHHQAEVLAANIAANEHKLTLTITALVKKGYGDEVQRIRKDLLLLLS